MVLPRFFIMYRLCETGFFGRIFGAFAAGKKVLVSRPTNNCKEKRGLFTRMFRAKIAGVVQFQVNPEAIQPFPASASAPGNVRSAGTVSIRPKRGLTSQGKTRTTIKGAEEPRRIKHEIAPICDQALHALRVEVKSLFFPSKECSRCLQFKE